MKKLLIFLPILFLLFSCTSEIARVDLSKNKNVAIEVKCEKHRQIDFYLDCDIEYLEKPNLVMDFEFYRGELQILKGGLDPLKNSEALNGTGDKTSLKFYGKLEGNFIPPGDTIFTIKPTLIGLDAKDVVFNKFELVLVR